MSRHLLTSLAVVGVGCGCASTSSSIPNYHSVEPGLRRGGQPTSVVQWKQVAADLDAEVGHRQHYRVKLDFYDEGPSDDGVAVAAGFVIIYLPMQPADDRNVFTNLVDTFVLPSSAADDAIYQAITSHLVDGVYIGCVHGQDRTGYSVARFRVLHDGWDKGRAWNEWQSVGPDLELVGLQAGWARWQPPSTTSPVGLKGQ